MKIALKLAYDGTDFHGWQKQSGSARDGGPSVQETLERVLAQVSSGAIQRIVGSGRTDSGVHAVGQVAHARVASPVDLEKLLKGANSVLPPSIRVLAVREVPEAFHAQRSATGKQYSYYVQQGACNVPAWTPYSWWIRKQLDWTALVSAAEALVGEQEFGVFQARGAKPGPTIRRVDIAEWTRIRPGFPAYGGDAELLRFRIVGSGFLKQMVRGIVGTLVEVGEGKRPSADMLALLASQARSEVGATAPGRGLWLEKVFYPRELTGPDFFD